MNNIPLISTHHLEMRYGNQVILQNVNFTVYPNQFTLLIGPNGGGKTTLIRLLLGLLKPTAGEIKRHPNLTLGYLPQYQKIDKQFPITVEEIILSGLLAKDKKWSIFSKPYAENLPELLELLHLKDLRKRAVSELSGGQLQRVLFARAVIANPNLLILDEPDTYLDAHFQKQLHQLLKHYARSSSIILVTHNPHGLESLANDIWRVDKQVSLVDNAFINAHHKGHIDEHC